MPNFALEHVNRVRSVVLRQTGSEPIGNGGRTTESWIRCYEEYRLEPESCAEPEVVPAAELQEREAQMADVQAIAKVEMANLYQQLADSGYAIILTDHEGVMLNYFGDPAFTHAASKTGLMPGAVWSERVQGTNGMGTCLFERRPVTVHQDEHYLARNIGLSCAAAPIFDHQGELVGVLDASGESRMAQQHTLALVRMSVQMIENRVFLHQFRHDYIVRMHNRAEFVGTLSEGAIAVSMTGRVLAVTRYALFLLGIADHTEIVGRDIGDLFNITLAGLIDSSARKSFYPVPIFEVRNGARFFCVVHQPVSTSANRPARLAPLPDVVTDEPSAPPPESALDKLHFGDPVMKTNVQKAKRILDRNVAIMLLGETGTGKEKFARAMHASGSRAGRPFVAINCASIPESLIESELFGYRSGAFTGASKDGQRGKLLQANSGTLFLDEIGDMPVALQARLLRVLEEREVVSLGSESAVKLDIHLISATHCDLQKKIGLGEFREDLFYRLQGVTLILPPLRDRTDRGALIRRMAVEESGEGEPVTLDADLLALLEQQRWPGNIRQLRHLLRCMIALRETDHLTVSDLPPEYRSIDKCDVTPAACLDEKGDAAIEASLNRLESAERRALCQELQHHEWNLSDVARVLGISRNTLYRKLQRLSIKPPEKPMVH